MSAREALSRRRVRESRHPVWTADPTQARRDLEDAKAAFTLAFVGKVPEEDHVAALSERIAQAQGALDACCEWLVFHGLDSVSFEELVQAHPPAEDANLEDAYDEATFVPALIAACCQDSDLTADEWAAELAGLNPAERRELIDAVMEANTRTWSSALPKG